LLAAQKNFATSVLLVVTNAAEPSVGDEADVELSLSAQRGLMALAKLIKRLATPLILCLLGLAILSNRFFVLRQFTVRLNQNASFHLPIDSTIPSQAGKRTFVIAIPNEGVSDLQQLPRDAIGNKTDPGVAPRDSWVLFKFQTDLSSRPPTYILQSALNL
jgi:hypothetical protein